MAKFNIEAILHRRKKNNETYVVWTRLYARIETAVRRCTEIMVLEGEVGDVIEFTLRLNGWQIGTIRMRANGKMQVDWIQRKIVQEIQKAASAKVVEKVS